MKKLLILCTSLMLTFSCSEYEEAKEVALPNSGSSSSNTSAFRRAFTGDSLVLNNPYSVRTMKQALHNLKASHLYIKFKPQNEEQEDEIKNDYTMHLFDYRLNVEYTEEYLKNRAPRVTQSGNTIPNYYTALAIDKLIPNVPYEILETWPTTVVEVIFNNQKKVIFEHCTETNQCYNQSRNIFNPFFNNDLTEFYIITPEDYENAIPCNGNCN